MSQGADLLAFQMKAVGLRYEREYRFHPTRRWRFDFAMPEVWVAVEFEGGVFAGKNGKVGRHVRGAGARADMEKYNEAACLGWVVLRVMADHVKSGEALRWIESVVKLRASAGVPPGD